MLVATHGDLAKNKTSNEELRKKVEARFGNVFTIEVVASIYCFTTITQTPQKLTSLTIFTLKDLSLVVDSHAASSQGLKALKASLLAKKQQLIEVRGPFPFQHADMVGDIENPGA